MRCVHFILFAVLLAGDLLRASATHDQSVLDKQLLDACALGDLAKAVLLIENGANVNTQSDVGETPLHLSSINHNMELAKHLIDKGAGVNTRAHGAKSLAMAPLHWFLFMNQCGDGVEALVEHGADVNALCYQEDGNLLAPLDIAEKVNGREREKALLLAKGAKRYSDMTDQERHDKAPPSSSKP